MEHVSVYFIRTKDHLGLIKIGITNNIAKRIENIQTHNPYELNLLYLYPCESRLAATHLEKQLHLTFRYCQKKGEWFSPSKPLRELIAFLAAGGTSAEAIKLAKQSSRRQLNKWQVTQKLAKQHK